MTGEEFFAKAQARVAEICAELLAAERKRRSETWPEYTQFMWRTEAGWESFLKGDTGVSLKAQIEATAWRVLFCHTCSLLSARLDEVERQLTKEASK